MNTNYQKELWQTKVSKNKTRDNTQQIKKNRLMQYGFIDTYKRKTDWYWSILENYKITKTNE